MALSSSFKVGEPQADGRWFVKETHVAEDGRVFDYEYMASEEMDSHMIMQERALIIQTELDKRAAAKAFARGSEVPYTKYEFLDRFTADERIAVRERAKTDAHVQDFMEMLNASGGVFMSLGRHGLTYLAQIGVLTAERVAIIGAE